MRLLFVTATRIGDAVLSMGLLHRLVERHPTARITIVCGAPAAPLFGAVPGLEDIVIVRKQAFRSHWLGLWARLCRKRWDLVVDLRASALAYLLRADRRLVSGKADQSKHRVAELGELLGEEAPPAPRLFLGSLHHAAADELLPPGRPVLALAPTANWPAKQWPIERFAAMANGLTGEGEVLEGASFVVSAAAHERTQAEVLLRALPGSSLVDLIGCDLLTTAACFARAHLFVGNDSGLMHLAAAAGAPTLGLFGPTNEQRYAPWGPRGAFLRTPQSYAELAARPDFGPGLRESLMTDLSVEAVMAAARALLRRTSGSFSE